MQKELTEYDIQANEFLKKTRTRIYAKLLGTYPRADWGDNKDRDQYSITLYKYKEDSISDDIPFDDLRSTPQGVIRKYEYTLSDSIANTEARLARSKKYKRLRPYDILACLTKYDPGLFEDFCGEFGYEEDSRQAYKTYEAVRDEYLHLSRIYSLEELEELELLQEIN